MKLKDIIGEFSEKNVSENSSSKQNLAYMHYNAAINCIKHGKLDNAKHELKEAVKENPKFYDGFLLLSLVVFSMGSRLESIRTINMISDRDTHALAMKYYDLLADENASPETFEKVADEKEIAPENEDVDNSVPREMSPELAEKIKNFQSDFDKRFKTAKKSVSGINSSSNIDFGDEFYEFMDDDVVETEEPKNRKTEEPVETENPENRKTEKPVETENPENRKTEESVETENPENRKTEKPVETENPENRKTEEPVETENPENRKTEEPVETEEPKNRKTEESVETEEPKNRITDERSEDGFFVKLLKNRTVVFVAIIIICLIALVAIVLISTKLHKSIEENTPTKAPVTAAPTSEPTAAETESVTETPTSEPTAEPTEAPTDTPVATPTTEPTPSPTREPDDSQKAENATVAYNSLKKLYENKKYYECAALIKSTDFTYLPESLVSAKDELCENALTAFGKQYHALTFNAVNSENWTDAIKYAQPLVTLYPEWEKISSIYFHLGKAYEMTGDKTSAKKYYNITITEFPGTSDAEHASYRLSIMK